MCRQISIIIATYNASKTLNRCLDSIVHQLNDEVELIIIDGGSTDSTNEIIRSYRNYVNYTISEKDKGIYDAWNKGVNVARGEWLAFIGADDILCEGAIDMYLKLIHSNKELKNKDYICARMALYTEKGEWVKDFGSEPTWKSMKYGMSAAHPMSLHNKHNLFDVVGLYDINYKICADYELLLRKREKLDFLYLPQVVVKMQIGGASFSEKGVRETYMIRKNRETITQIENLYKYIGTLTGLRLYRIRHRIKDSLGIEK